MTTTTCPIERTLRADRLVQLALAAGRTLDWCEAHRGWHVEAGA